ncbi:NF-kappa-B inhibitor delta [Electrophorus electricus]|uniref:NF-kappa-B inhibitor delta n=1 Tax=Electrophorus electricus TaxID=8005 RepID=UPI0015D06699|nr:NF-kappa-B inhibitor delta [Electrophorus electricus]
MPAMRYNWETGVPHSYPALQHCGSFPHIELSFGNSFSPGTGFVPSSLYSLPPAELQGPAYSLHQPQDCPDGQMTQHFPALECAVTVAVTDASADPRTQAVSLSPAPWDSEPRAQGPTGPCGLQFRPRMDMAKLEEARLFIQSMDYRRTTWQDDDGDTILHIYTAKGQREYAFAAAERLQELGRLDSKEHKGKTALLVAVTANQPEIVQDLLSLGADISMCDIKGQTALHLAATYGFPEVMQVILSMDHGVNLEARNFDGLTPLHCAVISHGATMKALTASSSSAAWTPDDELQSQADNKLSCLQMLFSAGASLLSQEIKSNKTALHLAVKDGNIQLVHFFLKQPLPDMQAFINMKAHGHTALHMAAGLHTSLHQEDIIRLLLTRGADPSVRNLENDQPAHLLQSGEQGEKLKLILKKRNASSRRRVASLQDQD